MCVRGGLFMAAPWDWRHFPTVWKFSGWDFPSLIINNGVKIHLVWRRLKTTPHIHYGWKSRIFQLILKKCIYLSESLEIWRFTCKFSHNQVCVSCCSGPLSPVLRIFCRFSPSIPSSSIETPPTTRPHQKYPSEHLLSSSLCVWVARAT